jgi:hypothetical protein
MKMLVAALAVCLLGADVEWRHLSSERGELPSPAGSKQQTGALIAPVDKQKAAGIIISYRVHAPALVWIRKTAT